MAQKQLNYGTVAGDGTGDILFTSFKNIDDNFNELYLENVVHINSASDFPAAIGGVRELVPTPGDDVVYLIAGKKIDMGSDRFTVTGGDVVIRGTHLTASELTTTNAGAMFTSVDSTFINQSISFDCPNADLVTFSNPSLGQNSLIYQNVTVLDCDTLGTIDDAFITSFNSLIVETTATNGFLWTGADNSQLTITNSLAASWSGKLFDLGTADFNLLNIGSGNRFISNVGNVILSGEAASGNINVNGRALVSGTIFNGDGTALENIMPEDPEWTFTNNVFTDGVTRDTEEIADVYLTAEETVTVLVANDYYLIGGVNWLSDVAKRFTVSTAGVITYIGLDDIDVVVNTTLTLSKVGGGSDKLCSKIAKNGVESDKTIACTQNATPTSLSNFGTFALSTGDQISIEVANEDSTSNITVSAGTILVSSR